MIQSKQTIIFYICTWARKVVQEFEGEKRRERGIWNKEMFDKIND
jgi:hypothetical protein